MTTLFISDLHLSAQTPAITQAFLQLLARARNAEALYILGDLFEFWLGDDDHSDFHTQIITQLRALADSGVKLYFMRGNRDFLIGKKFLRACGASLLKDPTVIHLYGKRVLLLHGDSLCTEDIAHQRFRKYAYKKLFHFWFLWMPLWWRRARVRNLRQESTQKKKMLDPRKMNVVQAEVEKMLRDFQVPIMIHGHVHQPGEYSFMLDGQLCQRLVMSDWDHRIKIISADSAGIQLIDLQ